MASFWSGGSEGSPDAPAEEAPTPFSCPGGCSPPPAQGEGGCYCLYIFFQTDIRFRLDQDEAAEPQSVVGCDGVLFI